MSLPLERWAKQAVLLERKDDFTPVASRRVLEDVRDLATLHRATWRERQRGIDESGDLQMAEGAYGSVMGYPPAATITTTSINGTVNLWPQAVFTPIPANSLLVPQTYRLIVAGKITTVAAPGNIGFDPRIGAGTWTTGGTAFTGVTMGASTNVALTASITAAFYRIMGDITVRSLGVPGTNAVAVGMFHYLSTQNTAAGLAGPAAVPAAHNLLFGGTPASYDFSTAQGIGLGAVHSVTSITHNVEQIIGLDWN